MTTEEAIRILNEMLSKTAYGGSSELGGLAVKKAVEALRRQEKLPKWKEAINRSCWSGEIGVNPTKRKFEYEHYVIDADKLFEALEKEE